MKLKRQIFHVDAMANLVGINDRNLRVFKQYMNVSVTLHDRNIIVSNADGKEKLMNNIFDILIDLAENGISLTEREIIYVIKCCLNEQKKDFLELYKNAKPICMTYQGKKILPKTFNQKYYTQAIKKNELTFGIGPAGTGKTFLGVAVALDALKSGVVKKIILTRPVVEAGESLGFLPGDVKEKIDPYLVPLYDSLYDIAGFEMTNKYIENKIIEIAPLAFMRGRTLEDAFVILDEAQNTTKSQMKMFLTRLGFSSRMLINGDPTQIDLPKTDQSGLLDAIKHLEKIENVEIIKFETLDVIRNPIVQKILESYHVK